jgi:limonene-1,2-epoxide hydrolase
MGTTEAEQIVTRFVAAWERADVDELLDYFAEDAVWHPIPMEHTVGKAALRERMSLWLDATAPRTSEITLQVSDGKTVMHERTDRYLPGSPATWLAPPLAAVFEIDNGLITAWREYFDMSPYEADRLW